MSEAHKVEGRIFTGDELTADVAVDCDVCVIGSGSGGAWLAHELVKAGTRVVLLEEGGYHTRREFDMLEGRAYMTLYQQQAARGTDDLSITIFQGRSVGGGTTVNWCSSFRTPERILALWRDRHGVDTLSPEVLAPHWDAVEQRLRIKEWPQELMNANNKVLWDGLGALGYHRGLIRRNVNNCHNLGACGLGCPVDAKQSMLVTTIPSSLEAGARLFYQTRAQEFVIKGDKVEGLICVPIRVNGQKTSDKVMRITAKHYVVSGGAINSPALLKRSKAPDPHDLLGTRTFLHPVAFSGGVFDQRIEGWAGAPQSIYSDHFVHNAPHEGPIGYKLEATPMHPGLAAVLMGGYGKGLAERFQNYPNTQMMLALLRDGFHPESSGGNVILNVDGSPLLNYSMSDYVLAGFKQALLTMAEVQFAAGAKKVMPLHEQAQYYTSWAEAKAAISAYEMKSYYVGGGSAHIMGGCRMGGTEKLGVVSPDGVHWQLSNLSVHDGSLFPTSIGANPQLSIYGLTNRLATGLAKRLSGKDVSLAA